MSHIETSTVTITDLESLKAACKAMGAEFLTNQKTYTWFGRSVGDAPIPNGVNPAELGHCDHAIRVPGVTYEVGVAKQKDGKGFNMLYDFYGQSGRHDGQKLKAKFGDKLTKLVDAYSLEALKRKARAKGYLTTTKVVNGKTHLTVSGF